MKAVKVYRDQASHALVQENRITFSAEIQMGMKKQFGA